LGKHSKKSAAPAQEAQIKEFLDMISPGIIKFNVDHFLCGNTYRCVWALREYPTYFLWTILWTIRTTPLLSLNMY
jgi:hypothetical protein